MFFLIIKKENIWNLNRTVLLILLLFNFTYLISTLFAAANKYNAVLEFIKMLCFTLFFVVISLKSNRESFLKNIFRGCFAVSLIGLFSYIGLLNFSGFLIVSRDTVRLQSLLQYANVTAVFMGIGYFISHYFSLNATNFKKELEYNIYSFVFLVSMMLTFSRGTLLVFISFLVVILVMLKSAKSALLALANIPLAFFIAIIVNKYVVTKEYGLAILCLLGSIAIAAFIFVIVKKHENNLKKLVFFIVLLLIISLISAFCFNISVGNRLFRLSFHDGTLIERLIYAQDSISVIKSNPLLGIGPGNWVSQQFFYQTAQYYTRYIHTGIIQFALDAGIFAALLFLCLLFTFYKDCISSLRLPQKDNFYIFSFVIVSFVILHSLIDVDLSFISVLMIIASFIALSVNIKKTTENLFLKNFPRHIIEVVAITLLISFGIIYLIGQILSNYAQNVFSENNFQKTKQTCNINEFFKPFDGDNYLLISKCLLIQGENKDKILYYLNKAHKSDIYQPKYLKELINYLESTKDYASAYQLSRQLIIIEPLNNYNYEMAINNLKNMFQAGTIKKEQLQNELREISDYVKTANSKINPLSVNLRLQKPISINTPQDIAPIH